MQKGKSRLSPLAAFWAKGDLCYGPWRLSEDGCSDWSWRPSGRSAMFASDDEAREAYLDLVGGSYGFHGTVFTERHWAFWRFEQGLSAAEAFERVRELRAA